MSDELSFVVAGANSDRGIITVLESRLLFGQHDKLKFVGRLFLYHGSYQHPAHTIFNSKLDSITTLDSLK